MRKHTPNPTIERRHTSPQAKWLLNEAAALRGELARVVTRQDQLKKREAQIRKTLAALEQVAAPLPVPVGKVAPTVVTPHSRYGPRGQLTKLVLGHLEAAWPKGVDIHSMVDWVAQHCGVEFANTKERDVYRHSVRNRLHHLADQGKVRRMDSIGTDGNGAGVWCLASKSDTSIDTLRQIAAAADEQDKDGV